MNVVSLVHWMVSRYFPLFQVTDGSMLLKLLSCISIILLICIIVVSVWALRFVRITHKALSW